MVFVQGDTMNRRDFIRSIGLGAAAVGLPSELLYSQERTMTNSQEVLSAVDERIEKYRKADAVLKLISPDDKPLKPGTIVKISQKKHKFLFGCNIFKLNSCRTERDNEAYAEQFAGLLNFATLPFYWWNYTQRRGEPSDARTDEIVSWCKAHNVTTKGHPLAWNYVDPRWLPDDPVEAMKEQLARITRCVSKFAGDIDIWDVVNEATEYDRADCKRRSPVMTRAIKDMGIGQYVRGAFKTARQANPKASLIINDYRTGYAFANKVIAELKDAAGKAMYDVIGIQSHMHGGYWGAKKACEVCDYFARFGKPLHFTELTLVSGRQGYDLQKNSKDPNFHWVTTPEGEKRQAEQVVEFYKVLFSHPAVEAITWWDFTDQNAWQMAPAGLVRADMSPKPAYERLIDLVKNQWWTTMEAKVDGSGQVGFRGFCGDYAIETKAGGRKLSGALQLDKTSKKIEVTMQ